MSRVVGAVFSAAVVLAACAQSASPGTSTASTPGSSTAATAITAAQGSTPVTIDQIDPGLKPYIDIAVADLAQRLSVDASDVGVTSATLVQWPDSALGCPQPGLQYAQVATDGSVIVLTAGGKTFRYHAGGSRKPFLCEQPSKAPPTTS